MRFIVLVLLTSALLSLRPPLALAADDSQLNLDHPGVVALSKDTEGNWIYKSFPELLPLYVFDDDEPGKSNCDPVCIAVWPILKADENAKPIGNWTIINRGDGKRQWAYKSNPVYTFYDDAPDNPKGAGKRKDWYYEEATDQLSPTLADDGERAIWRLLKP